MLFCKKRRAISTLIIILIVIVIAVAVGATAFFLLRFLAQPLPSPSPSPSGRVVGSGNLVTEDMDLSDFTIVEVGSTFEVKITQSESYSVSVTADDNLFDYIQVSQKGETLTIGLKPSDYQSINLKAEITMPHLYELGLFGATHGIIEGFSSSHKLILSLYGASSLTLADMSAGDIEIDLSGASSVTGDITNSGDANFTVSGASIIELEGAANDLIISADGASHLELSDFPVHNANANLNEGSDATINLDGRLDADLNGGSHLYYIGEPTMGDINKSGGSTVSKK